MVVGWPSVCGEGWSSLASPVKLVRLVLGPGAGVGVEVAHEACWDIGRGRGAGCRGLGGRHGRVCVSWGQDTRLACQRNVVKRYVSVETIASHTLN